MKYFSTLVFLLFVVTSSAQEKAVIGMTLNEVMRIYPTITSDFNENGTTLLRPDTLYGLAENWGYRFKNDTLNWIFFHKYVYDINETNFKECLAATRKIIKDFTIYYGKPNTEILGNTNFVDPYKNHHWGYHVIEVHWVDYKGMKISVQFRFFGGKGEYAFLVEIHYFDKDYPYFE